MSAAPTKDEQQKVVDHSLRAITHIATLPEITVRIIELVEDPTSTAQDLRHLIENDPALCARVLKVVNSSFYGMPGQIDSIERAVVLLGLNAVKNIAISASLTKLFHGGKLGASFSARDLWVHSAAVATAGRMLADRNHPELAEQAFLAGLMHDIGIMVELQLERNRFIDVLERVQPGADGLPQGGMRAAETELFGADHERFGEGLCKRWKFPPAIAAVCGYHHDPLAVEGDNRRLTAVVNLADQLAARAQLGFSLDVETQETNPEVAAELGLSEQDIESVLEELEERVDEMLTLLS